MNAPRMRRRYRTSSPKRGLLYLLLFLVTAAGYVGQRVYAQRLRLELGHAEYKIKTMEGTLDSLRAERDRLTSAPVLGPRAQALGLAPADVAQLARVPLTLPEPVQDEVKKDLGFGGTLAKVWDWLDLPTVHEQEVLAAP